MKIFTPRFGNILIGAKTILHHKCVMLLVNVNSITFLIYQFKFFSNSDILGGKMKSQYDLHKVRFMRWAVNVNIHLPNIPTQPDASLKQSLLVKIKLHVVNLYPMHYKVKTCFWNEQPVSSCNIPSSVLPVSVKFLYN